MITLSNKGGPQWFPEDYDYQKRPDAMLWAWNATATVLASYPESYYTIGLRGPGDEPATCDGRCTLKDKADHGVSFWNKRKAQSNLDSILCFVLSAHLPSHLGARQPNANGAAH